jgi:lipopolysaccharide transport system permease protein
MSETALQRPAPVVTGVRVVEPVKRRIRLSEIWTTLPVARMVGQRDMKIKYKQSVLGPVWLVLQPFGMLVAISIAFAGVTNVDTGDVPYILFALAGLCVWVYFQQAVTASPSIFPNNYQVVRRSPCPRVALITANLISQLPPLGVVLGVTLVGVLIDRGPQTGWLVLPIMVVWLIALVGAVTTILAAVAARFRDAVAVVPLVIQAGIFVSPVGYPLSTVPDGFVSTLLHLNPVSGLIEAWRWSLLGTDPLEGVVLISLGWTALLLYLGWTIFARLEVRFADYV